MSKVNMSPCEWIEEKTHSSLFMLQNIRDTIELVHVASDSPTDISKYMDGVTILIDHAADEIQVMLNEILGELKKLDAQKVGA